jgi:hypothetical protein
MPLYNLACRGALDEPVRARVAEAVTRAHCEVTGAPAEFVNVMFVHHYPLRGRLEIDAIGGVRQGGTRTAEVVERLRQALHAAIVGASGLPADRVAMALIGIPSGWVMEGGGVMPEPGAEHEWMERRAAAEKRQT